MRLQLGTLGDAMTQTTTKRAACAIINRHTYMHTYEYIVLDDGRGPCATHIYIYTLTAWYIADGTDMVHGIVKGQ